MKNYYENVIQSIDDYSTEYVQKNGIYAFCQNRAYIKYLQFETIKETIREFIEERKSEMKDFQIQKIQDMKALFMVLNEIDSHILYKSIVSNLAYIYREHLKEESF